MYNEVNIDEVVVVRLGVGGGMRGGDGEGE